MDEVVRWISFLRDPLRTLRFKTTHPHWQTLPSYMRFRAEGTTQKSGRPAAAVWKTSRYGTAEFLSASRKL